MTITEAKREIFNIKRSLLQLIAKNKYVILNESEMELLKIEIHRLYNEYLKIYVQISRKVPNFNNGYWPYDNNCYYYALDLPTPSIFIDTCDILAKDDFSTEVGDISELPYLEDCDFTKDVFLKYFYSDLDTLNIEKYCSTINSPLMHGGYKVAVFYDEKMRDYHFIRQNSDGTWSQKFGLDSTICFSESPLHFLNSLPIPEFKSSKHYYEYVETLELVKPT